MDVARSWCFDQYAQDDVPVWIEAISIDTSKDELFELLKRHYDVDGSIDFEFEVGSYCQWYKNDGFSLYALVQNLLVFVDKTLFPVEELSVLEEGERLFQSDKNAVSEVLPIIVGLIDSYSDLYRDRLGEFMDIMGLEILK